MLRIIKIFCYSKANAVIVIYDYTNLIMFYRLSKHICCVKSNVNVLFYLVSLLLKTKFVILLS